MVAGILARLEWNTAFFPVPSISSEVFSDAAGTLGCGAFTSTHQWFQITWPEDWHSIHITAKELLPVIVAAAIWGSRWSRQRICFRCDNMAVFELLLSRTSQDQLLMHFSALFVILRCLFQIPVLRDPGARHSKYSS